MTSTLIPANGRPTTGGGSRLAVRPTNRWHCLVDTGEGWRTVYRQTVIDALVRATTSPSCPLASPCKGVAPLGPDALLRVLDGMDRAPASGAR